MPPTTTRRLLATFIAVVVLLLGAPATGSATADASEPTSIDRLYRAYFHRDADAAGRRHWIDAQARGMALETISEAFSGSPEFRQRYGSLDSGAFVDLVYRNVLDRPAEPAGHAHWTGLLRRGLSRGALMVGFSESEEFRQRLGRTAASAPSVSPRSAHAKPEAAPGTYRFLHSVDGKPGQWAACTPVPVVANFAGAPAGSEALLRTALARISDATKTPWILEGTTTERAPSMRASRPWADLARYGNRYAPVLVSWAERTHDAEGDAIAYGGAAYNVTPSGLRAVTGSVTLDPAWNPGPTRLLTTLLHELGHVAGLAHVDDRNQVMFPIIQSFDRFQAGDVAGLARVGSWDADCSRQHARTASTTDVSGLDGVTAPTALVAD